MRSSAKLLLAVCCLAIGAVGGALVWAPYESLRGQAKAPALPVEITSYREVVKSVVPAVVSIESRGKPRRVGSKAPELGFGSGVIVDPKGVILTNFHVIEGADSVEVSLPDGRKFSSKDIRGDRKTDLAIVRIQSEKPLPALELGDSDQMEVGDRVLAVGAPFGLTGTVTHGIISAKSRNLKLNFYEDFLQTDAAINPGNSGGPLISLDGKVIGINSAIKSKTGGFQGVGLAISSNLTKEIMTQLLRDGTVRRGYLGVQIRDVDNEVATKLNVKEGEGVLITKVFDNAPGSKGGLKTGDVVLSVGGKNVKDGLTLQRAVASLPVGKEAEVSLIREGKPKSLSIKIEEQPEDYGMSAND